MRIRKNAKISGFLYPNTNLSTENSLCQLNQSPWDIITFPSTDSSSSLFQFDNYEVRYNVNYAANGSSVDSIGDFESVASETSGLHKNDNVKGRKQNYGEILRFKEEGDQTKEIEDEVKLCDRLDSKGWQCGNVLKNGNTLCDSHLSELQNYVVWTTDKKSGSTSGPAAKCRPNRPKKRSTTNPHEFYYYSGFGPSWGKKRGTVDATVASNSNIGFGTNGINGDDMELDRFDDDDNGNDDEKGKLGITGKRKGRKPVKERSLKSLM